MAIVIHTINGSQYAYNHHRVGNKVICDYIGKAEGSEGGGDSAPVHVVEEVTQQPFKPLSTKEIDDQIKEKVTQHEKDKLNLKRVKKELTEFNKEHRKGDSGIITRLRRGREIDIRQRLVWAKEAEENSRPKLHIESFEEAAAKPTGQIYEPIRNEYGQMIGTKLKQ